MRTQLTFKVWLPTLDAAGHMAGSEAETLIIGTGRVGAGAGTLNEVLGPSGWLRRTVSLSGGGRTAAAVVLLHPADKGDTLKFS